MFNLRIMRKIVCCAKSAFSTISVAIMRPVLFTILIVLSESVVSPQTSLLTEAASSSSTATAVNHNRFYTDTVLSKKYDPYDNHFFESGKESGNVKRSRGKDSFDSQELELSGGVRSGQPLSTSVKENLANYRDTTGCPPAFNGLCKCGYDVLPNSGMGKKKKYIVNCDSAGFSSAEPLESLPGNTERLIFTGNNIPSLPVNIFGNTRTYPDLIYIDLSSNGIERVLGKTFHKVSACETLILNNNKISRYTLQEHKRIFSNFVNLKTLFLSSAFEPDPELLTDLSEVFIESNLTKLEKLHLEHNGIDYINEPKILCPLPSLLDFHLSQNVLSDVDFDFSCLTNVRYIDLTYNKIRTVTENSGLWRLLHTQGHQIRINLLENPFNCDCRLDKFIEAVRNFSHSDFLPSGEVLRCVDGLPKNNTRLLLKDVMHTECPVLQASDYGSTAVSVIAWILGIFFLAGIGYFIYTNQSIICRPVNPLHQTTTQGVKYTSIQEEEAEVAHV